MGSLFPLVRFDPIDLAQANDALSRWAHRMGPLNRPYAQQGRAHGLFHGHDLVAVTTTSHLITANVGGVSVT